MEPFAGGSSEKKPRNFGFGILIASIFGLGFATITLLAFTYSNFFNFANISPNDAKETIQTVVTKARRLSHTKSKTLSPTEEYRDVTLNPTEEFTLHPLSDKTLHPTPSRDVNVDDYNIIDDYAASVEKDGKYYRKELRELTREEWHAYCDAIWIYKNEGRKDGMPYLRTYDELVVQHSLAANNATVGYGQTHTFIILYYNIFIIFCLKYTVLFPVNR